MTRSAELRNPHATHIDFHEHTVTAAEHRRERGLEVLHDGANGHRHGFMCITVTPARLRRWPFSGTARLVVDPCTLFAYGKLMNEVDLRRHGARPARLAGWRRSFNHASTRLWGSEQHPCPTLGLSPGGECWGVAFEAGLFERRALLRRLAPSEALGEFDRVR